MAGSSGPNIVNNNLVLHLDAANTKSFRGLSGTNLIYGINNNFNNTNTSTFKTTYSSESVYIPYFKGFVNTKYVDIYNDYAGGSGQCCPSPFYFHGPNIAISGNTAYTYQIIFKTTNGYYSSNYMYRYEFNSSNTLLIEGGLVDNSRLESLGDGWYHAWGQFTSQATATQMTAWLFHYEYLVYNRISVATVCLTQGSTIHRPEHLINFDFRSTRGTIVATGGGWKDRTQYENNGELVNGPTYTSNNGGNIILDGTNDYIVTPSFYDLSITNQITATIWCKSNTSTWNDYGFLISKRDQFILHPTINSKEVVAYVNTTTGGWQSIFFTPSPEITTFNSYTLHYTSGVLKIYFNGVLITTNNSVGATLSSSASQLYIGKDSGIERYFNGQISSVMIYNRALSDNEILQNYYAHKSRFNLQ